VFPRQPQHQNRPLRPSTRSRKASGASRGARVRVASGEDYEVDYFARKRGITTEQAEQLIRQHGNSRAKLDAEAEKLKGKK
jgi:hypothetical protein